MVCVQVLNDCVIGCALGGNGGLVWMLLSHCQMSIWRSEHICSVLRICVVYVRSIRRVVKQEWACMSLQISPAHYSSLPWSPKFFQMREVASWYNLTTLYVLPCYMQQLHIQHFQTFWGTQVARQTKIEGSQHTHTYTLHIQPRPTYTYTHKFWIRPHIYNRGWAAWSGWPRPDHLQSRCFAAVVRFDLINKGLDRVGLRNPGIEMCWRPTSHCEIICLWFWDDVALWSRYTLVQTRSTVLVKPHHTFVKPHWPLTIFLICFWTCQVIGHQIKMCVLDGSDIRGPYQQNGAKLKGFVETFDLRSMENWLKD